MDVKSFQEKVAVVSCGIVEEEVRIVLDSEGISLQTFFLDPALHIYPETLASELTKTLDELSASFNSFIIVYGHCHPNMNDLLATYPAVRVKASNCVEMILGSEDYRNELRREPGTFFLTPGWCKIWGTTFIDQLKLNTKAGKVLFRNYKRALFIDLGINTEKYRSKAKDFSEHFSLQFEEKNADLKHFRKLLKNALAEIIDQRHQV